tara:strand:+ start:74 stop:322 length:249 start_codon:yes stop_codon:yes gene_type:complete
MKHLFKITETIEYEFEISDSEVPLSMDECSGKSLPLRPYQTVELQWDDIPEDSPLMKVLISKMNGDYATSNSVTLDEVTSRK